MPHHGTKSTSFFIQFGGRYLHSRQLDLYLWSSSSQAPGHMHGALSSCLHVVFIVKWITCPIFHRHVDAYAIDRKRFLGFIRGINNTRSTLSIMQIIFNNSMPGAGCLPDFQIPDHWDEKEWAGTSYPHSSSLNSENVISAQSVLGF